LIMRPVRDVLPETQNVSDERILEEAFSTALVTLIDRGLIYAKEGFDAGLTKCESPIERRLFAALCGVSFALRCSTSNIYPQAKIGDYRADFLVVGRRKVAIECDGHDFHERTKEQARRDKARDRYFASQRIAVARFTGSEIWANPIHCAEQALHIAFAFDGERQ
jgi:very-short-patch-repair endonuclease